jgi:hypothetical protein
MGRRIHEEPVDFPRGRRRPPAEEPLQLEYPEEVCGFGVAPGKKEIEAEAKPLGPSFS